MRALIKGLGALLVLGIAVIVGVGIYLSNADFNSYRGLVAEQVKGLTGRDLTIAGNLDVALSLNPAITVSGVTFANADWGSRPEMAKIGQLNAEFQVLPFLLRDKLVIDRVVLSDIDLLLETDAKGQANWDFGGGDEPFDLKDLPEIYEVALQNANLTLRDGVAGTSRIFQFAALSLTADSLSTPLRIQTDGTVDGSPVTLAGRFGSLQALTGGDPINVDLTASFLGVDLTAKGTVADLTGVSGVELAVTAAGASLKTLSPLLGDELPDFGAYTIAATLADRDRGYVLRGIKATFGKNDMKGRLALNTDGPRPYIGAAFTSQMMDLRPYLPEGGAEATGDGRVIPEIDFPVHLLTEMDGKIDYKAARFITPRIAARDLEAVITLSDGKLRVDPAKGGVGGGTLLASLEIDGAKKTPPVAATITIRKMDTGKMMADLGVTDVITGAPLNADINVAGSGSSLRSVLASLGGQVKLVFGEGRINNDKLGLFGGDLLLSLYNKVNPFEGRSTHTVMTCGVANFAVKNGVMSTDHGLAMETKRFNLVSSGVLNLKNEALDFGLATEPREGIGLGVGNLASFIRLGGNLAHPTTKIDELEAGKTVLKLGGAVVTGGVSVLAEGLMDRSSADADPCRTAQGLKPRPRPAESSRGGGVTDTLKQGATGAGDAVKKGAAGADKAVKDAVGGIKGLFD